MPKLPTSHQSLREHTMIGRTVGNYIVREKIGEGGMGAVYRAEHPRIGRSVAIKVLRPEFLRDPQIVARFFTEAKAAHDIGHQHIVEILDFGELDDGTSYIIMEWLVGRSLAALLRAEPLLSLRRTLHIVTGIGQALAAAHGHGVIHRDLKPDNIFLVQRGEDSDFVKVLDFGLAKLLQPDEAQAHLRTHTHAFFGTPAYMSPEQCRADHRHVDPRSDVYALGVILYEMAVGRRPFVAEDLPGLLLAHLTQAPPDPRALQPLLPVAVEAVILRALQKQQEFRFQAMAEFLHALSKVEVTDFVPVPVAKSTTPVAADQGPGGLVQAAASPAATGSGPAPVSSKPPTVAGGLGTPTAEMSSAGGTLNAAAAEVMAKPRRSSRRGLLIGGVATLGIVAAGILTVRQSRPAPASTPTPTAASPDDSIAWQAAVTSDRPVRRDRAGTVAAHTAPMPAGSSPGEAGPSERVAAVHIAIRTVPADAQLSIDGASLENPFSGELARTAIRRLIVAEARGYRTESRWVVVDHDQELILKLRRAEAAPEPPAGARGRATGSRASSSRSESSPEDAKPPRQQPNKPRILTDFSE